MVKESTVKTVPRHRRRKTKHRVFLTLLVAVIMLALICALLVGGYVMAVAADLPDITAADLVTAQTSFVYDSQGNQIATLHGAENRVSVPLDQIPQYLQDAVVASEDIRFYEHHGVDLRSIMRAMVVDLRDSVRNRSLTFSQGASTITMQLVKNVVDETEKTLPRKIKQALLAIEFEKHYTKQEILYYYLNEIYMAPSVFGMQAAAEYYFNKDVSEVTLAEAATLAAILRAPGLYDPYHDAESVLVVRNAVLGALVNFDPAYEEQAALARTEPLVVYEGTSEDAAYEYPWFVDYVISETMDILEARGLEPELVYTGGLHIHTTLDVDVQQVLEAEFADPYNFPGSWTGDIVESAMVIVETSTGKVRGLMGGREYTTRRGFNRATDMLRSPGSTIKPLVTYAPAIDLGYGAAYVIDDSPISSGGWSPNNDDFSFMGRIPLRQAVMYSRNVCAVKLLMQIGEETGWEYGVKNGLPLVDSDCGLAMTLGGLTYGVSPMDMAGGFATLGNYGVHIEPYTVTDITTAAGDELYKAEPELVEVFSAAAAYIMTDVLTSAVQGGTGTNAYISGWQVAGKTGTNALPSEDPDYWGLSGTKDAWFCGYTSALTAAVWMGYDNKKDEYGNLQYLDIFGGSYPAALFSTVMSQALYGYANDGWYMPDGVSYQTIDTKTGDAPTELTPDAYVTSDLVRSGMGVGGDGTKWVAMEICTDTKSKATEFCPNKEMAVRLALPDGKTASPSAADYALYQPAGYCTTHSSAQAGMVAVSICTECTNKTGVLCMANLAGSGASGGCPAESVQVRYYLPTALPTAYCSIASHQISGERKPSYDPNSLTPGGNNGGDSGNNGNNGNNGGNSGNSGNNGGSGGNSGNSGNNGGSSGNNSGSGPSRPDGLSASVSGGAVVVDWNYGGSRDNVTFIVERQDGSTGQSTRFSTSETYFTDSDVEKGVTYTYRVYASDGQSGLTSDWSTGASVRF